MLTIETKEEHKDIGAMLPLTKHLVSLDGMLLFSVIEYAHRYSVTWGINVPSVDAYLLAFEIYRTLEKLVTYPHIFKPTVTFISGGYEQIPLSEFRRQNLTLEFFTNLLLFNIDTGGTSITYDRLDSPKFGFESNTPKFADMISHYIKRTSPLSARIDEEEIRAVIQKRVSKYNAGPESRVSE